MQHFSVVLSSNNFLVQRDCSSTFKLGCIDPIQEHSFMLFKQFFINPTAESENEGFYSIGILIYYLAVATPRGANYVPTLSCVLIFCVGFHIFSFSAGSTTLAS